MLSALMYMLRASGSQVYQVHRYRGVGASNLLSPAVPSVATVTAAVTELFSAP